MRVVSNNCGVASRGEKLLDPTITSRLRCRYLTRDHPYLLLQPIKEEQVLLVPRVVIYHDVLSDSEIAIVKNHAAPQVCSSKRRRAF